MVNYLDDSFIGLAVVALVRTDVVEQPAARERRHRHELVQHLLSEKREQISQMVNAGLILVS